MSIIKTQEPAKEGYNTTLKIYKIVDKTIVIFIDYDFNTSSYIIYVGKGEVCCVLYICFEKKNI